MVFLKGFVLEKFRFIGSRNHHNCFGVPKLWQNKDPIWSERKFICNRTMTSEMVPTALGVQVPSCYPFPLLSDLPNDPLPWGAGPVPTKPVALLHLNLNACRPPMSKAFQSRSPLWQIAP